MAFTLMCVMLTVHFRGHRAHRVPHAVGAPEGDMQRHRSNRGLHRLPKLGLSAVLVMLGTYTPDRVHRTCCAPWRCRLGADMTHLCTDQAQPHCSDLAGAAARGAVARAKHQLLSISELTKRLC
jgi:hypothetical protein